MNLDSGATISERTPSTWGTATWAVVAAFGTYFSMYLFRKPFTASAYDGLTAFGLDYKTTIVTSQVFGYFTSKLIGIRVVSELPPARRALGVFGLVGLAQLALLLFAVVPRPWNIAFLFLNGLPLGMVFGLVVAFLEGRKLTELLTAGLCASFILADGVAKSLGQWLLDQGVPLMWMPAMAGFIGFVPLSIFTWMLHRIPVPTADDEAARAPRETMSTADRRGLCARHAIGLSAIVLSFVICTILRSIRADFSTELWQGFGEKSTPQLFAQSETLVAIGVLIVSGLSVLVKDNRRAFFLSLWVCGSGYFILLAAIAGWQGGQLPPLMTMVLFGLGLYIPYVAVHTTVFERMLAMTREKGTLAFLITLADSAGYLGYIAVMLGKNVVYSGGPMLTFFQWIAGVSAMASLICIVVAVRYFAGRSSERPVATAILPAGGQP